MVRNEAMDQFLHVIECASCPGKGIRARGSLQLGAYRVGNGRRETGHEEIWPERKSTQGCKPRTSASNVKATS